VEDDASAALDVDARALGVVATCGVGALVAGPHASETKGRGATIAIAAIEARAGRAMVAASIVAARRSGADSEAVH
jgi:hypothetical protein